jgi:hypothetical protein
MIPANLRLSAKEMQLINNVGILLTKNAILKKVFLLLETVQENQVQYVEKKGKHFPAEIRNYLPKISKGENYKGLPYLVLDYPPVFEKKNILAIRTLFWWGHFFSTTLHISGRFKLSFEKNIHSAFTQLQKKGFAVCINNHEWEHHFEEDNYTRLAKCSKAEFSNLIRDKMFLKLAKDIPLREWTNVPDMLFADFKLLADIIMH